MLKQFFNMEEILSHSRLQDERLLGISAVSIKAAISSDRFSQHSLTTTYSSQSTPSTEISIRPLFTTLRSVVQQAPPWLSLTMVQV